MPGVPTKRLSAEEFARLPNPDDGSKEELVQGEVVTLPPGGFLHGYVQGQVGFVLDAYCQAHSFGHVTLGSGVITETDPDSVRGPDVAVWSYARLPADQVPEMYATIAPDLCAEVRCPGSLKEKMVPKVREYLACGTRMVWVIDPAERTVTVYTKPGEGTVFWDDATLFGGEVLPGFTYPVAEFFE